MLLYNFARAQVLRFSATRRRYWHEENLVVTDGKAAEAPKTYTVVVLCAESLLRIPAERGIRIAPMQSPYGDYELMFLQRTEQLPHIPTAIPRQP